MYVLLETPLLHQVKILKILWYSFHNFVISIKIIKYSRMMTMRDSEVMVQCPAQNKKICHQNMRTVRSYHRNMMKLQWNLTIFISIMTAAMTINHFITNHDLKYWIIHCTCNAWQVPMVVSSVGLCEGLVPSMTLNLTSHQSVTNCSASTGLQQNVDNCSNKYYCWKNSWKFHRKLQ